MGAVAVVNRCSVGTVAVSRYRAERSRSTGVAWVQWPLVGGAAGLASPALVAEAGQVRLAGVHVALLLLQLLLRALALRQAAQRALDLLHLVREARRLALLAVLLEHHLHESLIKLGA